MHQANKYNHSSYQVKVQVDFLIVTVFSMFPHGKQY